MSVKINRAEIKALLKSHGGSFHGPRIEHLSIPEDGFWAFLEAALSAHTAEKGEAEPDETAIGYALRYGGMCRDCADTRVRGICDHSGMPCDSAILRKVMTHALKAWQYGVKHGFIANPVEAPPAPREDLVAEVERLRAALEPFKSGGNWGRYKAWLTCGPPTQADGVRAAKQITEWQVAVDRAALPEGRTDA